MTFSKTTEYALRTLTYMAENEKELHSSDALHKALKIPKKYLQRLLTLLSKQQLIESIRGKYGGYRLMRNSKKIYISQIVDAVEGFRTEPICFFGFSECLLDHPCHMHDVWAKSQNETIKVLSSTSLFDLIKK
ncbi:MAG: Rrf2 family transcriptional regulator [Melioribacteraceae bacterium]|jgi:Rrf2 family protein|nr:Rrf2 family transcriptional regulator [Melioribacteraceae bacterium]